MTVSSGWEQARTLHRWRYRALTSLVCAVVAGASTFLAGPPVTWDHLLLNLLAKARSIAFPERARHRESLLWHSRREASTHSSSIRDSRNG